MPARTIDDLIAAADAAVEALREAAEDAEDSGSLATARAWHRLADNFDHARLAYEFPIAANPAPVSKAEAAVMEALKAL